ncbi:MAG: LysM domain-containing protein, partial [Bacteroidales bacterium]
DTLSKIAVANHTTVQAICKLNGISTRTTLKIGRKLRVK